jgi:hypothetical protein
MLPRAKLSWIAWGCLFVAVCTAAAGANALQATVAIRYLRSGLFPLNATTKAVFRVALDDAAGEPPAKVQLYFLDEQGAVVARSRELTLHPGQSASLSIAGPRVVRAYAEIREATTEFRSRRRGVGLVTTIDDITQVPHYVPVDEDGLHTGIQ